MRWFFILLFLAIALAAGTAPLWWKPMIPLLGHPPKSLDKLSTYITAVSALLTVVAGLAGILFKDKESSKPEAGPTGGGSIIKGNVNVQNGDFVGRDKTTINYQDQDKQA